MLWLEQSAHNRLVRRSTRRWPTKFYKWNMYMEERKIPDEYGPRDWDYEDGFPPNKEWN